MKKIYTATEARADFFNIIENVLQNNEIVYIKKNRSNKLVKLESLDNVDIHLSSLAGVLKDEEATDISTVIKKARKYKHRLQIPYEIPS